MDEMIKYLKALVYLHAQVVGQMEGAVRPEILLAEAGLSHKEIATALRKSQVAVSKTISRAKQTQKENSND
jgi:DNA-directed RNA polymerase specialized sigma24 family protein